MKFESFGQTLGKEYLWLDLRVRKYNRTMPVLNGTLHLFHLQDNSLRFSFDLFHSRLGNQQFNHYPMKLPTQGLCELINQLHDDFPGQVPMIRHLPAKNECPISARQNHIIDEPFPSEAFPPLLPRGLWKGLARASLNGTEVVSCYLVWIIQDWL